jgi:ADP-ribose pyrophosphatase YjhB (NUDIX family)
MTWAPHVTVAAVIEQDGRYLLVQERDQGRQVLNQPAGHLEPGESLHDAVVREVLEETARPFSPSGLIGVYRWVSPGGLTFIRFAFSGEAGEPEPGRSLDPDIEDTLWLTETQIADRAAELRSPMVLDCIRDARQGPVQPLDLLREPG